MFVRWVEFFFSSRRRHTRSYGDWSSDVCSFRSLPFAQSYPASMPDRIRVACVQLTSRADKAENLEKTERLVAQAGASGADVVLLPEKWNARSEERRVGKEWRTRGAACER